MLMRYGWDCVFHFFGLLSLLWCAVWMAAAPRIQSEDDSELTCTAVHSVLRRRSCLAVFAAHGAWTMGFFTIVAWLPSILSESGLERGGLAAAAVPYVVQSAAAAFASQRADALIARGAGRARVRRAMTSLTFAPAIAAFSFLAVSGSAAWTLPMVTAAIGGGGFACGGYEAHKLDAVPAHLAGTVQGISSTFACACGAVGVPLAGALRGSLGSWSAVYALLVAVYCCGLGGFALLSEEAPDCADAAVDELPLKQRD
eukprot:TRINITY_DN9095_c0_g1_i1.p2 TRINITY_DN9095_c0_g1~~TRINITY_DN9095_c0_g1_i1.p2  ORF type:complete len:257 (+),score=56.06 TRINITY_DN9095_c0_g1_i1:562-1332(+)